MESYVLITGASSGIGMALAKVFASKGHNLLLVARRLDILRALANEMIHKSGVKAEVFSCDLSLENNIDELMQFISDKQLRITILINNAGLGDFSLFSESDTNKNNFLIDLNIRAVVSLTHRVIPMMRQYGEGKVLNVSSMAAFAPNPYIAVYAAAKSFILNFSHAIAAELQQFNIQVSVLCPGDIKSGFQKNAGLEGFEVQSKISVEELAIYAYDKFIIEGETEIIPEETRKITEMMQKATNRKILSANLYKMRLQLATKLKK